MIYLRIVSFTVVMLSALFLPIFAFGISMLVGHMNFSFWQCVWTHNLEIVV